MSAPATSARGLGRLRDGVCRMRWPRSLGAGPSGLALAFGFHFRMERCVRRPGVRKEKGHSHRRAHPRGRHQCRGRRLQPHAFRRDAKGITNGRTRVPLSAGRIAAPFAAPGAPLQTTLLQSPVHRCWSLSGHRALSKRRPRCAPASLAGLACLRPLAGVGAPPFNHAGPNGGGRIEG